MARYAGTHSLLGDLRKVLDVSEVFAHGFGVLMILVTAAVLDPSIDRRLPRVAACAYGPGLVAEVAEAPRPSSGPTQSIRPGDVWSTFSVVEHVGVRRDPSHSAAAPSSHFRPGTPPPPSAWPLACRGSVHADDGCSPSSRHWPPHSACSRHAHFVSDTLAAAAIGCLTAAGVFRKHGLGHWFARLEAGGWRRGGSEPECDRRVSRVELIELSPEKRRTPPRNRKPNTPKSKHLKAGPTLPVVRFSTSMQ